MKRCLLLVGGLLASACSRDAPPAGQDEAGAARPSVTTAGCGLPADAFGGFITLPEGGFEKGALAIYPEETPSVRAHVASFRMQAHEVTNRQFEAFVTATGHVTDAERTALSGDPGGGSALFSQAGMGGWSLAPSASWRTPEGPGSTIAERMEHPVVHVSLGDAQAYARWAGGRLPSEEEWEYAAVLGAPEGSSADSGAYTADGMPVANTWQGLFPVRNDATDGFAATAPVGCFPPSKTGLYDMIGNVWEWTATPYGAGQNTIKGGSFLCAENFCRRYRAAARQGQDADFSTNHIGFRIVLDVAEGG